MDNQNDINEKLLKYVKRQTRFSAVAAIAGIIAAAVMIAVAVIMVPQIIKLITSAESILVIGESSIQNAMGKIEQIDLETLNNAIVELEKVIKPISEFFGIFRN